MGLTINAFGWALCLLGPASATGQTAYESLRKGDERYDKAHYQQAETHYRKALEQSPKDWRIPYNLGATAYRQGNYPEAQAHYQQALTNAQAPADKADVLHNLGNAQLQQQQLEAAIQAYESSLRLRPGDADTKTNLQLAKKKLQQQQQQKQQQQQQNDQQQQPQNGQQPQQPPPPGDKPEQKPQQPQNGQPQPPRQPPADPQEARREEARRMLETAIGQEDKKNARKYRSAQPRKTPKANQKDW